MGKAMVERKNNQRFELGRYGHQSQCLFDIGRVIPVSEHHTFGIGSSSGCVTDCSQIIGLYGFGCFFHHSWIFAKKFFSRQYQFPDWHFVILVSCLFVENNYFFYIGQLRSNRSDFLQLTTRHKNKPGFRMQNSENKVVAFLEFDGQGDIYCSCVQYSQLADNPGITAFGKQGDFFAVFYSQREQSGSYLLSLTTRLFVAGWKVFCCGFFPKERIFRVFFYALVQ